MSKNTIEVIRRTEHEAEQIRADARDQAEAIRTKAREDAKRSCETLEQEETRKWKQITAETEKRAEQLKQKTCADARAEAEAEISALEPQLRQAVNMILRGMIE